MLIPLLAPASAALAAVDFSLAKPDPCTAGSCVATVTYVPPSGQAAVLAVDFEHAGAPEQGFAPDREARCSAAATPVPLPVELPLQGSPPTTTTPPCVLKGPVYATPGLTSVAVRVTVADEAVAYGSQALRVAKATVEEVEADEPAGDECGPRERGVQCGPGNGRRTPGGGEKVSHKGWPSITGILWKVLDSGDHRRVGGPLNDELLGHHGDETLDGRGGKDVIWGDWDPENNGTRQRDVLKGGAGNDWLYSSHGHNRIAGGPGRDYVWAYYGRGTIDCGPGMSDTARVRLDNDYRIRNCERIKNFCGFGSKPGGGCYKPGERPGRRRGGQ